MAPVKNPLFARYFNRFGARREERGNRELRREMLAGLSGREIEVGAGNGLNFPHYPLAVREVVAVEPEPYLRARAAEAAAAAPVPVLVTDGTAGDLPAADGEFDAVVVSGLLCSVPDVPAALCLLVLLRSWHASVTGDTRFAARSRRIIRRGCPSHVVHTQCQELKGAWFSGSWDLSAGQ